MKKNSHILKMWYLLSQIAPLLVFLVHDVIKHFIFPYFFSRTFSNRNVWNKALESPAKTYYRQYLQQQDMTPADFKGVTLDDLVVLEQLFILNVYVYDLQETEAGDIADRLVRRSPYSYQETMNLNLYEQHFSYVSDLEKYSHR